MELIGLLTLALLVVAVATLRGKPNPVNAPCERCGATSTTLPFKGTQSHPDFYRVSLNLCLVCTGAQESFINHRDLLSTESRLRFGRHEAVAAARAVWGERAIDMLALLAVAKEDMDMAQRLLEPESFEHVRPWLDNQIGGQPASLAHDQPALRSDATPISVHLPLRLRYAFSGTSKHYDRYIPQDLDAEDGLIVGPIYLPRLGDKRDLQVLISRYAESTQRS